MNIADKKNSDKEWAEKLMLSAIRDIAAKTNRSVSGYLTHAEHIKIIKLLANGGDFYTFGNKI